MAFHQPAATGLAAGAGIVSIAWAAFIWMCVQPAYLGN